VTHTYALVRTRIEAKGNNNGGANGECTFLLSFEPFPYLTRRANPRDVESSLCSIQLCSVSFRSRSIPFMHGRRLDWIEEWCCIFFTSLPRSGGGGKLANHTHFAERGSHTHIHTYTLAQDTAAGIKGCFFDSIPHKNCSLCLLINLTVNSFHFLGLLRTPGRVGSTYGMCGLVWFRLVLVGGWSVWSVGRRSRLRLTKIFARTFLFFEDRHLISPL